MKTALIFDTETSDSKEPEIIEAAWVEVEFGNPSRIPTTDGADEEGNPETYQTVNSRRFRPSKPITLGALATHHIMDEDLAKCAPEKL